jgi:D-serine deaminase-like pyridoxal phosphate-dependent protein
VRVGGVHRQRLSLRVDHPHRARAGLQKLIDLVFDRADGIARRDDFDREIGRAVVMLFEIDGRQRREGGRRSRSATALSRSHDEPRALATAVGRAWVRSYRAEFSQKF